MLQRGLKVGRFQEIPGFPSMEWYLGRKNGQKGGNDRIRKRKRNDRIPTIHFQVLCHATLFATIMEVENGPLGD